MTIALAVYRMATAGLSPLVPRMLNARVAQGKEVADRRSERLAKELPRRPAGEVIWLHGASVGETRLLLQLAAALREIRPAAFLLFTSQTKTSAELMERLAPENAQHQFAPVDTPFATRRFIDHWQPDICIFAEGEIWPNLLLAAQESDAKLALVNARMTHKSISGWNRWRQTAKKLFSRFDLILAADTRTASGLSDIVGKNIAVFGNLKSIPAKANHSAPPQSEAVSWPGPILLGASTHEGEEELLMESLAELDDHTRLILAPRHPDRGDDIAAELERRGLPHVRWSKHETPHHDTKVLLADTIGDMATWYRLSDHVYLGGAHRPGIGGHNPLEPLSHGRAVLTGPHTTNFTDMMKQLEEFGAVRMVRSADDLAKACKDKMVLDTAALGTYFETGQARLKDAAAQLSALLPSQTA